MNGVIISCSSSSNSDCETEDAEEESETDLEAPIKKRSRDRPGSVLSLLTEHVRGQMDQASAGGNARRDAVAARMDLLAGDLARRGQLSSPIHGIASIDVGSELGNCTAWTRGEQQPRPWCCLESTPALRAKFKARGVHSGEAGMVEV